MCSGSGCDAMMLGMFIGWLIHMFGIFFLAGIASCVLCVVTVSGIAILMKLIGASDAAPPNDEER